MGRTRTRFPSATKHCTSCSQTKDSSEFSKQASSGDGLYNFCKTCTKDQQRAYKRKRKLDAIEYMGGTCNNCGGSFHPAVYEFHHTDPTSKDVDPSKASGYDKMYAELDKCVMLCANCHRLEHHKENY